MLQIPCTSRLIALHRRHIGSELCIICRCLNDVQCEAYQHTGTRPGNCILIYRNSTAENGQTYSSFQQTSLYDRTEVQIDVISSNISRLVKIPDQDSFPVTRSKKVFQSKVNYQLIHRCMGYMVTSSNEGVKRVQMEQVKIGLGGWESPHG